MNVFKKNFLIVSMSISMAAQGGVSPEERLELGKKFIDFLNQYGNGTGTEGSVDEVFSPSYTSTFNGEVVVGSQDHLKRHLASIRKTVGGWVTLPMVGPKIDEIDPTACMVSYLWHTNIGDCFLIKTVIRPTPDGRRIDSITEFSDDIK